MLGLITLEIRELIPEVVALCGICFLLIITVLITRAITIRCMRKYWPEMQSEEIKELTRRNEQLTTENHLVRAENNDWYVKVKTIKAVTDKVEL